MVDEPARLTKATARTSWSEVPYQSTHNTGGTIMGINPSALVAELAAGNPVLVLQNLSLPIEPMWHYVVAVGYDLERGDNILRSCTTERLVMPVSTFERNWKRSGYWGTVALAPGGLPATAGEVAVLDALVLLIRAARPPPHIKPLQLWYGAGQATWAGTEAWQHVRRGRQGSRRRCVHSVPGH